MAEIVSVIICTYNSAPFLIETLDSVLKQTWPTIELIVSDDCSTDGTMEVGVKWLESNKHRFKRVELLTSQVNTGVSANANRGLKAAQGDWIKFLGADDALKPTCLEDNMFWILAHQDVKVLFSKIEVYKNKFRKEFLISTIPIKPDSNQGILAEGRSALSQYKMLLVSDRIHFSPSLFISRRTILSVGGFDEEYRDFEDYPLWLKLTRNDIRLNFMDKVTVNYRTHLNAVNNMDRNLIIKPNYFKSEDFRRKYTYPYLPFLIRNDQRFCWFVNQIFRLGLLNYDNSLNRWINSFLTIYLNPFRYIIWVQKQLAITSVEERFL